MFSFTQKQLQTFEAVANRIVPADQTAGAVAAGSVEFILRLLNAELVGEQTHYTCGLDAIEQEAIACFQQSFAALSDQQQDKLLREIEADRVNTAWLIPPQTFFLMLVEHVLEGFYADPGNGGNQDGVSWKMMGYRAEGGTW